jgi:hypothetical protein
MTSYASECPRPRHYSLECSAHACDELPSHDAKIAVLVALTEAGGLSIREHPD